MSGLLAALAIGILYGLWFGYPVQQRKARERNREQILGVDAQSWSR
jgi:hypothetical protein